MIEQSAANRSMNFPFRAALIVLVLLVAAGGVVYAIRTRTATPAGALYQTAKVKRGNIDVVVSATGPVSAAQSLPLTFKQSGHIAAIDVAPGQKVKAGQVLAKEDTTDLENALKQAQAQLAQEQAALEKVMTGPTQQQIDADKQAIAAAQQNVANAQKNLPLVEQQNARDAQMDSVALANAEQSLSDVQANYNAVKQEVDKALTADQVVVANAQQALDNAKKSQASVQQQVGVALQGDQTALQNAQQAVQNAQQNLRNTQTIVQSGTPVEQQQLAQAKNALYTAQVARDNACGSNSPSVSAGCNTAQANVNTQMTAINTVQAQIAQSQAQAQQQLTQAQQAVTTAQGNLQTAINTANADKVKQEASSLAAQQAVDSATAALKTAQTNLASDQAKNQGQLQAAQQQINTANASVRSAQAVLADQQTKAASAVQASQAAIDTAQQAAKMAQSNLAILTTPPTQADIDSAKAAVANAQAAVAVAQSNLNAATLVSPIDATVAEVNGAVGQWLTGGPISGTSTASGFILLNTLSALQVIAQVNEADMAKIQIGNHVDFTLDAFPNDTFTGRVAIIQPLGIIQQNIVNYDVTSTIESTTVKLLPGMTANVNIVTQQKNNVLTIPVAAITYAQSQVQRAAASGTPRAGFARPSASAQTATTTNGAARSVVGGGRASGQSATTSRAPVYVLENGKPVLKVIETGLSDGTNIEVVSGLSLGDTIITGAGGVPGAGNRTAPGFPNRGFGGFGG
ncbi:MAG: biotin/lipoyl-binding protein [Chloroflexi bacterium]|nr:biotin/lipoyl-binding protein [Chloroflexota bacterium]